MYGCNKILKFASVDIKLQAILSKELGISRIVAQVLLNRGIRNAQEAEKFLKVDLSRLLDPYSFSAMKEIIGFIKKAIANKTKIMIFGDYDADGVTALALFKSILSKMGADVLHYLPHRIKEGYGLNKNILQIAKEKNIGLLITVDCGTNSYEQIRELRRHNIDVIVTDHHEAVNSKIPPATGIVNPKLKNSGYGYRDLAGVGVVYKLCQALTGKLLTEELDLVSLGTIADVVPLTGENRILVKEGLSRFSDTKKIGLKALIETSGIKDKQISPAVVSYILGPRINASGRMDSAEIALDLLMSEDKSKANKLASILEIHNRQRQKIENEILEEAQDIINQEINFREHKIIVIAKEGWHQGVLGVVASKLADRFYRPTIIISLAENLCKGSGRSIKNFHLFEALLDCKEILENFGGHSHAVGLVINRNRIKDFRDKINRFAKEKLHPEDLLPTLEIDAELNLSDLNEALVWQLENLKPYGEGNPEPLFFTRNLKLKSEPQLLSKDTLKFWVSDGNITYEAIGFKMGSIKESLLNAACFDLVYTPRIDNWEGLNSILLEVKDIFLKD